MPPLMGAMNAAMKPGSPAPYGGRQGINGGNPYLRGAAPQRQPYQQAALGINPMPFRQGNMVGPATRPGFINFGPANSAGVMPNGRQDFYGRGIYTTPNEAQAANTSRGFDMRDRQIGPRLFNLPPRMTQEDHQRIGQQNAEATRIANERGARADLERLQTDAAFFQENPDALQRQIEGVQQQMRSGQVGNVNAGLPGHLQYLQSFAGGQTAGQAPRTENFAPGSSTMPGGGSVTYGGAPVTRQGVAVPPWLAARMQQDPAFGGVMRELGGYYGAGEQGPTPLADNLFRSLGLGTVGDYRSAGLADMARRRR